MENNMKTLSFLILLISLNTSFADELPSNFALPNEGKHCSLKSSFGPESSKCGEKKYQLWTCLEGIDDNPFNGTPQSVDYLLVGEMESDVLEPDDPNYCPKELMYVVRKAIRQSN